MSPTGAPLVSWVARWRQRLIKLPESIFFDLARCYLGEIRSPFNKQELLQRLENFITRPDIKSRILSLLTLEDRKLLSTVKMIPGLSEARLHELAAPDRSYLDFHIRVLNLEDRLLIWREGEESGIRLNPHIEQELSAQLSDSLVLDEDPQLPISASDGQGLNAAQELRPWLNDRFLAAIFSFIQEAPELFTTQDGIRKRVIQDFAQRFAGLRDVLGVKQEPEYAEMFGLALQSLRNLGLIARDGEVTQLDYERWLELASLPQERRLGLIIAAALHPKVSDLYDTEDRLAFFSQTRIADFARSFFSWAKRVEADKPYGLTALKTLWTVEFENSNRSQDNDEAVNPSMLANASRLGLFVQQGKNWLRKDWNLLLDSAEQRSPLKVEASLELVLTGQAPLMDLLVLAACTSLKSYGFVSVYTIGQSSTRNGFSKGIDDGSLISLLEKLSGTGLAQSVRFSIGEWYKDFASVRIVDGVVLVAEGRRRVEIEHSESIRPFVLARPAENIFVLDRRAVANWLPALEQIGVRTGLRIADFAGNVSPARFLPPLLSLDLNRLTFPVVDTAERRGFSSKGNLNGNDLGSNPGNAVNGIVPRQVIIEELKAALDEAPFSEDIRQVLTERLRGGLILSPLQLVAGSVRIDHSEARGLDYTGKIRIIEQAIRTHSDFLEVQSRGDDSTLEGTWRLLIWPQKLRQIGSDLVLLAQTVPEGKELSVMMNRVLSVKRVRGSIFG